GVWRSVTCRALQDLQRPGRVSLRLEQIGQLPGGLERPAGPVPEQEIERLLEQTARPLPVACGGEDLRQHDEREPAVAGTERVERAQHAFRGACSIPRPAGEHERTRLQCAEACLVDGAELAAADLASVLEQPQRLAAVP